ncbi:MAG TPA: ribose-phosphate pyrophosphokinase [Candidatus Krumholzibacteria bacterium]|nr:ribose-phosphate pyrophosphokinase [Candidatus Krumholzibacteria bacterium]
MDGLKLMTGSSNRSLAEKVAAHLGVPLCDVTLDRFADGEIQCKINENVRGVDVFIIQSTQPPAENLLELLILLDACFLASAERITVVTPYYGYARQDRKDQPRVPITAKLVAKLLEVAGTNRILTLDLHSTQIQGFFDIQADNLFAAPVLLEYIKQMQLRNPMIVSPDVGSTKIGRAFAKRLNVELAVVDKRRSEKDNVDVMNVIGDVRGRDVVILDDMITTGGTLVKAARAVQEKGANSVVACATHPVLAGDACRLIMESPIREVIVTNSLPFDRFGECPKVHMLDVSGLIAEAIKRIHYNESVSTLFV